MTAKHGEWTEPTEDVVDELTRFGTMAADVAVVDSMRPVGAGGYTTTGADRTHIAVRAALRMLLANGLIEPLLPATTNEMFYVILDPPKEES